MDLVGVDSARTYNIDQPELVLQLGQREADVVRKSGCHVLAAGDIGSLVQVEKHLKASGTKIPVMHPIENLDRVYLVMHWLNKFCEAQFAG